MRRAPLLLATALLFAAPSLTACGADEPNDTTGASEVSTRDTDASSSGSTPSSGSGGSAVIGVDVPDPDEVVADATVLVRGTSDEKVRVGVAGIHVEDKLTRLDLVFTPQYDDDGRGVSVYHMTGQQPHVTLLDRENLTEYDVVRDGSTELRTDPVYAKGLEGQPIAYQIFFPRPEKQVEKVDVRFLNGWPTFEDVPVVWEG